MKHLITLKFIFFFLSLSFGQQRVYTSDIPSWVSPQNYNLSPNIDEEEISQGLLTLLADYQINVPKEESHFRIASKITNTSGVQGGSTINVVFDPSYQKLTFHSINVIRNGEIINKLNPEYFQVIRRELNAENYLYDGSYTAMTNLSDVRVGDVVDLSYTIKGFNPIHGGKYSNLFYLNDYVPIGKVNIILYTKNGINYKLYNTDKEPIISTKNGYKTYNWTTITPKSFFYEEYIPSWKIMLPTIAVTDYNNWSEVTSWASSIFSQNEALSSELQQKIKDIDSNNKSDGKKIEAVLDFVQNEIRYLGLEFGIGSYKPNPPNKVFEQRYGDCKDKSLLMVKMLEELDIKAYPMLVNSTLKNTILELPPSPEFFDHCVVKVVDNNDNLMYFDPTLSEQSGTYKNRHFPNYEYGLVVDKTIKSFDTIISNSDNTVYIYEEYDIKDLKGKATLNVKTTYTDVEADRMRYVIKNTAKTSFHNELENFYAQYHNNVRMRKNPVIEDNKDINELIIKEFYAIDSIWKPMNLEPNKISVEFVPSNLLNILVSPNMDSRRHPIELPYPVSRYHTTKVKLPQRWRFQSSNNVLSNDVFYYDSNIKFNKKDNIITAKNYLKIQKPLVEVSDFKSFKKDINLLEKSFGFTIFIEKDAALIPVKSNKESTNWFLTIFLILIATVAIAAVYYYVNDYKK